MQLPVQEQMNLVALLTILLKTETGLEQKQKKRPLHQVNSLITRQVLDLVDQLSRINCSFLPVVKLTEILHLTYSWQITDHKLSQVTLPVYWHRT